MVKSIWLRWNFSIFLVCFVVLNLNTSAQDIAIAVDKSGSMRGFFNSGSINNYVERFVSHFQENRLDYDSHYFLQKRLVSYSTNYSEFGNDTFIDAAFDNLIKNKYKVIILVTDNLQSSRSEVTNTLTFYNKLKTDEVNKVYVKPLLLDFSGRITSIAEKPWYQGKRGLLCYFILLDKKKESLFKKVLSVYNKDELLLIKPITKNEIKILGISKNEINDVKTSVKNLVSNCPDTKNIKLEHPNTRIVKNGLIIPFNEDVPPKFDYSQRNLLNFYFTLSSSLNHINIGNADDPCDRSIELRTENVLIFSLEPSDKEFFKNKRLIPGIVYPPSLVGKLRSQQQNNFYYYCELFFGPFDLDWNLTNFLKFIRLSPIKISIQFDIILRVPQDYFSLTESIKTKYFSESRQTYDKIYSPVDMIRFFNQKPVKIKIHVSTF